MENVAAKLQWLRIKSRPNMIQKTDMQIEFEKWAESKGLDLTPNAYGMGTYNDIEIEMFWECWKTATDKAFEVL
jgi:hypothetical protein